MVPKQVLAITKIARDHEAFLGDTLVAIAREKAAAMAPLVPCVTTPQEPDVMAVLVAQAAACGAPLTVAEPSATAPNGLAGAHQQENAGVAYAVLAAMGVVPQPGWLDRVVWPGRLEQRQWSHARGRLWLDVAHNPDAAHAVVRALQPLHPQRLLVVLATRADKDAQGMHAWLQPFAHEILAVGALAEPVRARVVAHLQSGHDVLVCGGHEIVGAARAWLSEPAGPRDPGEHG